MERGEVGAQRALGSLATQPGMWGCQRPSPKPHTGGKKRRGRGAGRLRHLGEQERKSHAPCLLLLLFPHLILMNNTWRGMGGGIEGGLVLKGHRHSGSHY